MAVYKYIYIGGSIYRIEDGFEEGDESRHCRNEQGVIKLDDEFLILLRYTRLGNQNSESD